MTEEAWHHVADAKDIAPEQPIKVEIGSEEIALFNVDGSIYATADICTHAYASLAEGFQEGGVIECPLHEGKFDIKTGEALCPPVIEPIRTYPVKVENGQVFVKL